MLPSSSIHKTYINTLPFYTSFRKIQNSIFKKNYQIVFDLQTVTDKNYLA